MFKNGLKNRTKSKYLNESYCVIDICYLPNCIVSIYNSTYYVRLSGYILKVLGTVLYGDSN